MRESLTVLCLILILAGAASAPAATTTAIDLQQVDIPFEMFTLDNGLRVVVHEDRKAPIVAVNLWYHVGSKDEKPGKTGFAHLFEHLMFNGSENFNDDYFKAMDEIGATTLNGTTSRDRTNYFQNVPVTALDRALWMESDRMGHLLGAIDQAKLDEQREVVKNEKRQSENQPYGLVFEHIARNTYPAGHPYSWTTIGSMDDLDAADVEDVHEWFKTFYGPGNAVLVIAGDIDAETALEKAKTYFGAFPPGPPLARHQSWIAPRTSEQRQTLQDRVPQARIIKVWNIPEIGAADTDALDLVSDVLSAGKSSRLFKRLVYDDQSATDASAYIFPGEIASQFFIDATAQPGEDLADVETALDEELARFLAEGPTEHELNRVKTQYFARVVRGIERIGGFGGKSAILAENAVYHGDPGHYRKSLERVMSLTPADLTEAARRWLNDGVFVLEVHPFAPGEVAAEDANRSQLPAPGEPPEPDFPALQRAVLSNGLKIALAERHGAPMVAFHLLVDAGYAADPPDAPGTASLAMSMLDEGTTKRTSLEIDEQLAFLGASLRAAANLDQCVVSLNALKANLDASLELLADVALNPAFPESDFARLRQQQLAGIQQEKSDPQSMALRVLPEILYGDGHAYSAPLTGSGTEESVAALTPDALRAYHATWFKPNNATLVVAGDTTLDELQPLLESLFAEWPRGETPEKNIAAVEQPQAAVYLLDRPDSIQSLVYAGHLAPPKNNPDEIAIETMNELLGGSFTSRINMNIREEKGWAYGAGTFIVGARGQRPFIAYAPVQKDKTAETIAELQSEIRAILSDRPATDEEVVRVIKQQTLTLPGRWEAIESIAGSMNGIVRYSLDDDYYQTYADRVRALTTADVQAAAQQVIHPDNLVWVVVGERKAIEPAIRALGFETIRLIDANGNVIGGE